MHGDVNAMEIASQIAQPIWSHVHDDHNIIYVQFNEIRGQKKKMKKKEEKKCRRRWHNMDAGIIMILARKYF